MSSSGQKILRSITLVMGLAFTAKATGVLRDIIVAAHFGTSEQMDAFLVAATIAGLIVIWLKEPIQVIIVPLFTQDLKTRGERSAWENASIVMNTLIILLVIFAAIGWLLSPYLVSLIAPGFSQEMSILSADLTRLMMLTVVSLGLVKLLSAFFHSYQRFGWPGMISTVDNLVVIPSIIILTPLLGIYGLAISAILGAIAQVLVQTPILWKNRSYYKPWLNLKNPTLLRMARMSVPLFIGIGGTQMGKITDPIFASLLQRGSLSALAYGHRLTYTTLQLFVTSLTTVLFPYFSETAGVRDYRNIGRKLFKSLRVLFWIAFPLSIGILLLHEPLVRLVYHRGAFGEESVRMTGQAVFFYAIGFWAYSLSKVLSVAFYSLQDTRTPTVMGLVRVGIKILLAFALVRSMAHAGLALAESVSWMVKAGLLLFFLPKELRQPEYRKVFQSFGATVVITGAMGAVVFFILPIFTRVFAVDASFMATSMGLGATIAVGAGTYLIFSLLLQPAELKDLYRFVRTGVK